MSELAKMRAVAAAEFDQKFPPPSMELPGDEYDALEEQRKVEWGAWWEAWQLMAARQPAPVVAVKTWKDRLYLGYEENDEREAMLSEIADLRAALAATNRSQPATAVSDIEAALRNLVEALDGAFISTWQSTAAWQDQLEAARNILDRSQP